MLELEKVQADFKQLRRIMQRLESSKHSMNDPQLTLQKQRFKDTLLSIKTNVLRVQEKLKHVKGTQNAKESGKLILSEISLFLSKTLTMDNVSIASQIDHLANLFSSFQGLLPIATIELEVNVKEVVKKVPSAIRYEVKRDFEEIAKCYGAFAYRAVLAFCGRILEVCLTKSYYDRQRRRHRTVVEITRAIADKPLGAVIAECKRVGLVSNIPGLEDHATLINRVRVSSVHYKKSNYEPDINDAKGTVSFTIAALNKLFP